MAIIGPPDLPKVLQLDSEASIQLKKYILTKFGYPTVEVELSEDQFESIFRVAGDFIAHYFPLEQQLAVFNTQPLQSDYPMPENAYWIQSIAWDSVSTRIDDVFGAESFLFNIGNITGIQNILTDYHLLQHYRKFSQKILGTEGRWEWLGDERIRLYPTPKGTFPVLVLYVPPIGQFRTPQARQLAADMMVAEAKIVLGNARSKFTNIPDPAGGSLTMNGAELKKEGEEEKKEIVDRANRLAEPLPIILN